jgi:RNA polymerase sigma-70 factor, ECF subfamily
VRAYHPRVIRLCLSILMNLPEAEDAAQEAFVKAFASLKQYKEDLSFPAWVSRIASNHCLDLLRQRTRRKTDSLDAIVEARGEHLEEALPNDQSSAEGDQERKEHLKMARKALARLSPEYREILVLRELDGYSYEQIQLILRCSLDAVKARLRRAREALQEEARHIYSPGAFYKQEES